MRLARKKVNKKIQQNTGKVFCKGFPVNLVLITGLHIAHQIITFFNFFFS
jgi:hypothetical protein